MDNQITLHAPDISCQHCAMAIRRELERTDGVKIVNVDVATRTITLQVQDDAALTRARAALAEIGYPATQTA